MTRYLLDTHILIWWLGEREKLGGKEIAVISDPLSEITVSVASLWEMEIKRGLGKLKTPPDILQQLQHHNFKLLPISGEHALAVGKLPLHHHDPFDRMLLAQARCEKMTIITCDKKLSLYDVPLIID